MPGLTISWEYLTGCYVATDPASRQRAEWPPHPGRVFMAIAAAWFETGEDPHEGHALRWLEKLGDPQLLLPSSLEVFPREVVDVYVPVNDRADPYDWPDKKKKPTVHPNLGSVAIGRSRQARTFPSVWVGDAQCFLRWPDAVEGEVKAHRAALDRLCGKVTRIGHSSSLVRMWVADDICSPRPTETWVPDDGLAELQARRVSEGTLDWLDRQFNRRGREEHQRLSDQIAELKAEKKATKGRGTQQRKAQLDEQITAEEARLKHINDRDPIRPRLGLWTGYRRKQSEPTPPTPHTDFDSELLILTQTGGPRLPLAATLTVTQALRGAIMRHSAIQPPPPWVSGHLKDGQPLRDGRQHLAYIPLPDVSHPHADGHLLGVALVFPYHVLRPERGLVLGKMLLSETGEPKEVELQLGRLGDWKLKKRDWTETRKALQPETWIHHPPHAKREKDDTRWASVTPVVLDCFPKSDPVKEREAWQEEIGGIIATACERIGLPAPLEVAFGTTSWHRGSPRATVKRRPLRGHPELTETSASLGDGFPSYPTKGGNGTRPQWHVYLRFAEPVIGPILLCAGRFQGYGLFKPLGGGSNR
jgi:CRISPR-associated protein Csb2